MNAYKLPALVVRSYCRFELPGWGRLLRVTGASLGGGGGKWYPATSVTVRGKWHGYLMPLDLKDLWDRQAFFLRRFTELETELTMARLLRRGDIVIDIGANRGMFTLSAAALVGTQGRVLAIEPNPHEAAHIAMLVQLNDLEQVSLERVAVADENAEMELRVLDGLSGLATLAPTANSSVTEIFRVPVRRGDELLGSVVSHRTLIKIDVEGFESRVLRGLEGCLRSASPALYIEIEPQWLARAGTSAEEIFFQLKQLGYAAYKPWTRRALLRRRLVLTPIAEAAEAATIRGGGAATCRNVLFIRPGSVFAERLSLLCGPLSGPPKLQ